MGDRKKKKRMCPECRKSVNSRFALNFCDDDMRDGKESGYAINNTGYDVGHIGFNINNTGYEVNNVGYDLNNTGNTSLTCLTNSSSLNLIPSSSSFHKGGTSYNIYDRHCQADTPYECNQPL